MYNRGLISPLKYIGFNKNQDVNKNLRTKRGDWKIGEVLKLTAWSHVPRFKEG